MKTSESLANIAPALVKAQSAIETVRRDKTGKILTKSGREYEYTYADLADVVSAVKIALNDNGIAFIQDPDGDASGVFVTTTLLHVSGEWISSRVFLPVLGVGAQSYGSAITYAKRYGLQSIVGLPSDDDDDADKSVPPPKRPNTAKQVAVDALNSMSTEEQKHLQEHATVLVDMVEQNVSSADIRAYFMPEHKFDNEERLALWALLPSNVRSAIKKAQQENVNA